MKKSDKISKADLIKKAKQFGFFKKEGVQKMYARTNGHFYYTKPPTFLDEHETHEIKREDVDGKGSGSGNGVEYPFNQKDTVNLIKECDSQEKLDALVVEGKLLENDERQGVNKALKEKKEQLSQ